MTPPRDPSVRIRQAPPRGPGLNKTAIAILAVAVLVIFISLPFLPWPSLISRGPKPEKPVPPVSSSQNWRDLEKFPTGHVPRVPQTPAANGTPPPPETNMERVLKDLHDRELAREARLQVMEQALKAKPPPTSPAPVVDHKAEEDARRQRELADKRREDAKKKREAFASAEPIFYQRKADEQTSGQLRRLNTPYGLAPTTLIPCQSEMDVSSDSPGSFRVFVTSHVHDSATMTHVVIPQGSAILMKPTGQVIFGDSRIPIEASLITFPNGSWVKLGTSTASDQMGTAGFTGRIDRHWGRLLGSVLITGVLRGGTTAVAGYGGGIPARIGGSIATETASRGTQEVRQFMRTDPTITVPRGYGCHLLLEEPLEVDKPYER